MQPQNQNPTPNQEPVPKQAIQQEAQNPIPVQSVGLPSQPEQASTPSNPAATDGLIGMTGSQLQPTKVKLPKGVFVIAAFSVIGLIASFFDSSQNNFLYTMALVGDVLLTIGLFLRLEMARKLFIYLSILIAVLCVVAIFMFVALQDRLDQITLRADLAIAQIEKGPLSPTERQQIDAYKAQMEIYQKKLSKYMPLVYAKYAVTAVLQIVLIVYLMRPKVKEVFRKDFSYQNSGSV